MLQKHAEQFFAPVEERGAVYLEVYDMWADKHSLHLHFWNSSSSGRMYILRGLSKLIEAYGMGVSARTLLYLSVCRFCGARCAGERLPNPGEAAPHPSCVYGCT